MSRLTPLLAALLACGLIAAGCGDDDDDNGDASQATTESAPAEPTDSNRAAAERCKRGAVAAGSRFSEEVRRELRDICEEAAGGDAEDRAEASRDICRTVVEEKVPKGQARERALEACDSAAAP